MTCQQIFTQKDLTEEKIFQKV